MPTNSLATVAHLAEMALFAGLDCGALERIRLVTRMKSYRKGDLVLTVGDHSDAVFFVVSGHLKITDSTIYLGEEEGEAPLEVIYNLVGPGCSLGELHLVDGNGHSASAIALEPVICIMISHTQLNQLRASIPLLQSNIEANLAATMRGMTRRSRMDKRLDLAGNLAGLLLGLEGRFGVKQPDGLVQFPFVLTSVMLASMVGRRRESVTRTLAAFARLGLIRLDGSQKLRKISIINSDALHKISEGMAVT